MSDDNFAPDHLEGVEYIMRKQNNDLLGGIIAQQQTRIEELEAKLRWVLEERDATFALMLKRAETAEAQVQAVKKSLTTAQDRLAKAHLALNYFLMRDPDKPTSWEYRRDQAEALARETLEPSAELKGQDDE